MANAQPSAHDVATHFERAEPEVRAIYDRIVREAARLGEFHEEPKKTSIHLSRKTAFAGVMTRRSVLILTLKASSDIRSPRVMKHERASANRWHLQLKLASRKDVDAELVGWLQQAYALAG